MFHSFELWNFYRILNFCWNWKYQLIFTCTRAALKQRKLIKNMKCGDASFVGQRQFQLRKIYCVNEVFERECGTEKRKKRTRYHTQIDPLDQESKNNMTFKFSSEIWKTIIFEQVFLSIFSEFCVFFSFSRLGKSFVSFTPPLRARVHGSMALLHLKFSIKQNFAYSSMCQNKRIGKESFIAFFSLLFFKRRFFRLSLEHSSSKWCQRHGFGLDDKPWMNEEREKAKKEWWKIAFVMKSVETKINVTNNSEKERQKTNKHISLWTHTK